jgi:Topoisomerase 6 subunit A/Spo11, Toprim domain
MKGDIKAAVYAVMPDGYAEASFDETIPAPARQVMYAVRRLSGLGDRLDSHYFLNRSLLDMYLIDHEEETPEWDIVRDDRGTFQEPHTGSEVRLGTIAVRDYLSNIDEEPERQFPEDVAPTLSLDPWTDGPLNRFGTVLYIEKEGFIPAIRQARIPERYDLAIASCKGYSVKAARRLMRDLADRFDVRVLVARDFDKAGFGIHDTLGDGFEDLGLRLEDIEDDPDLDLMSESVEYDHDPRPNLRLRGATEEEIDFLVSSEPSAGRFAGRRVELNALVGQRFIDWLEAKLVDAGVEKVIPDEDVLRMAWQHAHRRELINQAVRAAYEQINVTDGDAPDDIVTLVTQALEADPIRAWADVVVELATTGDR